MPKKSPAKPKATTKRTKSVPKQWTDGTKSGEFAPVKHQDYDIGPTGDLDGANRFQGNQKEDWSIQGVAVVTTEPAGEETTAEPAEPPSVTTTAPPSAEPPSPPSAEQEGQIETGGDRNSPEFELLDSDGLPLARMKPGESRKDCWERIRKEGRAAGLPRHVAYERANRETDRLFSQSTTEPAEDFQPLENSQPTVAVTPAPPPADDQGVSGLGTLPADWPSLPANAQLQVEIAWVSANRLRVRDGTGVNLSKALSPAPSYSALSWLETSILFPAKFADISVKATADNDSEREFIKREKLAIEEIRSILGEMLEAEDV